MNIFKILCVYVRVCHFSGKTNSFDFFKANLPKNGFRIGNSENCCCNKNQHPRYAMCVNFQSKWTTLNFSAQICPKKDLGFETEKSNVGIRVNIVEILNFRSNWTTLSFSVQICPKMDLGFEIEKTNAGTRIRNLEVTCGTIFWQNRQIWLFWPKFGKK